MGFSFLAENSYQCFDILNDIIKGTGSVIQNNLVQGYFPLLCIILENARNDNNPQKKRVSFTHSGNYTGSMTKLFQHTNVRISFKIINTAKNLLKKKTIHGDIQQCRHLESNMFTILESLCTRSNRETNPKKI
jgi:hypothetical protein